MIKKNWPKLQPFQFFKGLILEGRRSVSARRYACQLYQLLILAHIIKMDFKIFTKSIRLSFWLCRHHALFFAGPLFSQLSDFYISQTFIFADSVLLYIKITLSHPLFYISRIFLSSLKAIEKNTQKKNVYLLAKFELWKITPCIAHSYWKRSNRENNYIMVSDVTCVYFFKNLKIWQHCTHICIFCVLHHNSKTMQPDLTRFHTRGRISEFSIGSFFSKYGNTAQKCIEKHTFYYPCLKNYAIRSYWT